MLPGALLASVFNDDDGVGDGDARGGDDGGGGSVELHARAGQSDDDDAGENDDGGVAGDDGAAPAPLHFLKQLAWVKGEPPGPLRY